MVCNATRKYIIFQALKKFGQVSYEAQNIVQCPMKTNEILLTQAD